MLAAEVEAVGCRTGGGEFSSFGRLGSGAESLGGREGGRESSSELERREMVSTDSAGRFELGGGWEDWEGLKNELIDFCALGLGAILSR